MSERAYKLSDAKKFPSKNWRQDYMKVKIKTHI